MAYFEHVGEFVVFAVDDEPNLVATDAIMHVFDVHVSTCNVEEGECKRYVPTHMQTVNKADSVQASTMTPSLTFNLRTSRALVYNRRANATVASASQTVVVASTLGPWSARSTAFACASRVDISKEGAQICGIFFLVRRIEL